MGALSTDTIDNFQSGQQVTVWSDCESVFLGELCVYGPEASEKTLALHSVPKSLRVRSVFIQRPYPGPEQTDINHRTRPENKKTVGIVLDLT